MSNSESQNQESNAPYQNQVGPNLTGKGTITIFAAKRPAVVRYVPPLDPSLARVLYAVDDIKPDKPLPPQDITINNASRVNILYDVSPNGGDLQISWTLH